MTGSAPPDKLASLPTPGYEPPAWVGKPSPGLHLDVLKVLEFIIIIIIFNMLSSSG